MNLVWFLMVCYVSCSSMAYEGDEKKCLNIPEVSPKKYFLVQQKYLPIILETSSRLTHQFSTHVFYIFVREVLGYPETKINLWEDNFDTEAVVRRLHDYNTPFNSNPMSMATINLEVWVTYNTLADTYTDFVADCGIVGPPGRFGWFIPLELDAPVRDYYRSHIWTDDIREVHWSYFLESKLAWRFHIDANMLNETVEKKGLNRISGLDSEYVCDNSICERSMYTPDQCKGQNCAVLLAPKFKASRFLIDQINEMRLLVKVLWLGDHLKEAVELLKYQLRGTSKSLLIFNWYPSDVIKDISRYTTVTFKKSELYNFTHNENVGYKYDMHRLVKMAFNKIADNAKPLYYGLKEFRLEAKDYQFLLETYERNPTTSMREIACNWMIKNENKWWRWKRLTETVIYIGGIFPINTSSYNGQGIVMAATLAVSSINKNRTVLPDYKLKLLALNGKCKADNVMKAFIDFIVEGYYPQLVGVLGPACSETVEPLAGVSKHYRIMVISYSAEGASFSDRKKYPYFFRTIGENKHYKHVYLKLFQAFGWRRVAALTEDGQKYTEYISFMQDDLEKNSISFIANKKFPRERETEAMMRYLVDLKSKRARIIIADVVDDVARTVMCEAHKLKMTAADGYVWFLPVWLNKTWYDTDYFNINKTENINCTTKEMIKAITGYFAMSHAYFAPDDSIMQENITVKEWRGRYDNAQQKSDYAGFAYDAVWTYALALDKLAKTDPKALANLHSEDTTNKLVRKVEETDFYGVSGRIKFRGGPSRFSVINVMQWYDNSTHIIGSFYPNLTDDEPEILGGELKLNMSALKWFTPEGKIPKDGNLPPTICAVEGLARMFDVECQTAVIILNVIVAVILLLVLIGVCLFMKRKYEKKVQLTKNYMRALGLPFDMNSSDLDKWEIARESVVINRKLGEGAFGTVYGGEANLPDTGWCAVAVKTLKVGSTTEEKLDFLSEAEVMKRFDHKNIIKLLGVCTKEEPVYTIMEFMLYGDLKTYLLARRHLVNKNTDESEEVSAKRLTSMALDVARGLSYLAEMKYVHRDVASRNCLVNAQRFVKLGDFGMTRAMFENDYYKFTRRGMLPVRWMSPESLELGVFKPSSDVWSYGVLLYEIITFGSFPFQGKSNAQVLELVKAGHTLNIPKGVKPQLEGLIKSCWNRENKMRPAASEIVEFLANNPRLLTPCLDAPLASLQLEDNDQVDLNLPIDPRKGSMSSKGSPTKPSNGVSPEKKSPPRKSFHEHDLEEGIPLEGACPEEPLLGTVKSTPSLLNLGKFVQPKEKDKDDSEYVLQDHGDTEDTTNI